MCVQAYETAEAASMQFELPKILSFHKFARRDNVQSSVSNKRRSLERDILLLHGKDQITTGVDARNCKVRDWSIDFSDSCSYLGSPGVLPVPDVRTNSRGVIVPEISTPSAEAVKEVHGGFSRPEERHSVGKGSVMHNLQEAHDDTSERSSLRGNHESKGNSASGLTTFNNNNFPSNREDTCLDSCAKSSAEPNITAVELSADAAKPEDFIDSKRSSEHKKAVTEYVSTLLLPLYKTRKISKDGFKAIVKKSAVKVCCR